MGCGASRQRTSVVHPAAVKSAALGADASIKPVEGKTVRSESADGSPAPAANQAAALQPLSPRQSNKDNAPGANQEKADATSEASKAQVEKDEKRRRREQAQQIASQSPARNILSYFEQNSLFSTLQDKSFLSTIVEGMQTRVFSLNEYVIRKGEVGRAMFFILRGSCEVVSQDGETVFDVIKQGNFFGEVGVLFSVPRTASVRSKGRTLLLVLTQDKLTEVGKSYPQVREQLRMEAEERFALFRKRQQGGVTMAFNDEGKFDFTRNDLSKVPLFRNCEVGFLHMLTLTLRPKRYMQHEYVVRRGDLAMSMFFIVRGRAEVVVESTLGSTTDLTPDAGGRQVVTAVAELRAGAFFGEVGILFSMPRTASVRSKTETLECFELTKTDMDEVLKNYPEVQATIREEAEQRLQLVETRKKIAAESATTKTDDTVVDVEVTREKLKSVPIFKECDIGFLHLIALGMRFHGYKSNETIITKGEPGEEMFFLVSGNAQVVSNPVNPGDEIQVYAEMGPGSYFGEVSLFYDIQRTATVRAGDDGCTVYVLSKKLLQRVLREYQNVAEGMLKTAEQNYELYKQRTEKVQKIAVADENQSSNKRQSTIDGSKPGKGLSKAHFDAGRYEIEAAVEILKRVPLFHACDPGVLRQLALNTDIRSYPKMNPTTQPPSPTYIVEEGEISQEMFFVVVGECEIVSADGSKVYDRICQGDHFGEVAMRYGIPRTASVRVSQASHVSDRCDLFVLNMQALDSVLSDYPDLKTTIELEADRRLRIAQQRQQEKQAAPTEEIQEIDEEWEDGAEEGVEENENEEEQEPEQSEAHPPAADAAVVTQADKPSEDGSASKEDAPAAPSQDAPSTSPAAAVASSSAEESISSGPSGDAGQRDAKDPVQALRARDDDDNRSKSDKKSSFAGFLRNLGEKMGSLTNLGPTKKAPRSENRKIGSGSNGNLTRKGAKALTGEDANAAAKKATGKKGQVTRTAQTVYRTYFTNPTGTPANILDFDGSFLEFLLAKLDPITKLRCAQVCKQWRREILPSATAPETQSFSRRLSNAMQLNGIAQQQEEANRKKRQVRMWALVDFNSYRNSEAQFFVDVINVSTNVFVHTTNLVLKGCWRIDDADIALILQKMVNLERIDLQDCWKLTDATAWLIGNMCPKLKHLELSHCGKITGALGVGVSPQVMALIESGKILPQATDSNSAPTPMMNTMLPSLKVIGMGCPLLEHLGLAYCKQVTSEPLESIVTRCLQLRDIRLTRCIRVGDSAVLAMVRHSVNLTSLDLSDCEQVTDRSLQYLASGCPKLMHLSLSFCKQVTDSGIIYLFSAGSSNSAGGSGGAAAGSGGAQPGSMDSQRYISSLDLTGCVLLTDYAILGMNPGAIRKLTNISLRLCRNITDTSLRHLAANCPQLRIADFTRCPLVSMEVARRLFNNRVSLRLDKVDPNADASTADVTARNPPAKPKPQEVKRVSLFKPDFPPHLYTPPPPQPKPVGPARPLTLE